MTSIELDSGQNVRAISRSPESAGLPADVEVRRADLARSEMATSGRRGTTMHRHGVYERTESSVVDRVFFALSDPTRRTLLDRLHEHDGQRRRDLFSGFDISQQAVGKHVNMLVDSGLIFIRRTENGVPMYFIDYALMRSVRNCWIEKYLDLDARTDSS